MYMATTAGIGCPVFTSHPFFRGSRALRGRFRLFRASRPVATIGTYPSVVHLAKATVRLTAVASATEQLYVGGLITSATGKGGDVIVFQIKRTAATLTHASISCVDDLFRRF